MIRSCFFATFRLDPTQNQTSLIVSLQFLCNLFLDFQTGENIGFIANYFTDYSSFLGLNLI